ncbi:unnamed protein product, partial [Rotaria sp. Silwood1]
VFAADPGRVSLVVAVAGCLIADGGRDDDCTVVVALLPSLDDSHFCFLLSIIF